MPSDTRRETRALGTCIRKVLMKQQHQRDRTHRGHALVWYQLNMFYLLHLVHHRHRPTENYFHLLSVYILSLQYAVCMDVYIFKWICVITISLWLAAALSREGSRGTRGTGGERDGRRLKVRLLCAGPSAIRHGCLQGLCWICCSLRVPGSTINESLTITITQ